MDETLALFQTDITAAMDSNTMDVTDPALLFHINYQRNMSLRDFVFSFKEFVQSLKTGPINIITGDNTYNRVSDVFYGYVNNGENTSPEVDNFRRAVSALKAATVDEDFV